MQTSIPPSVISTEAQWDTGAYIITAGISVSLRCNAQWCKLVVDEAPVSSARRKAIQQGHAHQAEGDHDDQPHSNSTQLTVEFESKEVIPAPKAGRDVESMQDSIKKFSRTPGAKQCSQRVHCHAGRYKLTCYLCTG